MISFLTGIIRSQIKYIYLKISGFVWYPYLQVFWVVCQLFLTRQILTPTIPSSNNFSPDNSDHDNLFYRQFLITTICHSDNFLSRQLSFTTISHPDNLFPRQFLVTTVSYSTISYSTISNRDNFSIHCVNLSPQSICQPPKYKWWLSLAKMSLQTIFPSIATISQSSICSPPNNFSINHDNF